MCDICECKCQGVEIKSPSDVTVEMCHTNSIRKDQGHEQRASVHVLCVHEAEKCFDVKILASG